MAAVWDMDLPRDQQFVLLAYADHADHDGGNIWPAVKTIAAKCGYSERSIQAVTRELVLAGMLVDDGKGPKGTRKWRMPHMGVPNLHPSDVLVEAQPGAGGGEAATAPEPSITIPRRPLRKEVSDDVPKPKTELAAHFKKLTGVPVPDGVTKRARGEAAALWWVPLGDMLKQAGGDVERAKRGLSEAHRLATHKGQAIYTPKSLRGAYGAAIGQIAKTHAVPADMPLALGKDGNWRPE